MSHIFISHSHEDSDFAELLQRRLTETKISCWRDVSIPGGADWRKEIDRAIRDAFALVVVMTPEAQASEYVTYEWAFGWGAGVKVIPILLKATRLHPRLESLQYFDFSARNMRPWDELIELLREAEASQPQEEKIDPEKIRMESKPDNAAYERLMSALKDEGWAWRSIDRLSVLGGVSENEALELLRRDPNVVFSKAKSGRRIARLKSK